MLAYVSVFDSISRLAPMAARRSSLVVGLDSSRARRVACRAAAVRSAPALSHRAMPSYSGRRDFSKDSLTP